MSQIRFEEKLSFQFYLVTAPGMVREVGYAPRIPGKLVFPPEQAEKDYYPDRFSGLPFKQSFPTQASAFAHMMKIQGGEIVIADAHDSQPAIDEIRCNLFHADFYPVYFDESEYDALKFHGAMNTIPYSFDTRTLSSVQHFFKESFPTFTPPSIPRCETEDGNSPVSHNQITTILSPESWDSLRHSDLSNVMSAMHAFRNFSCNFHDVAEEVGKSLLFGKTEKADIILEGRYFSYRDTVPSAIAPEPAVIRKNLHDNLLAIKDHESVETISQRNPSFKPQVFSAIEFIASKLEP